jgi:hypothetical protein
MNDKSSLDISFERDSKKVAKKLPFFYSLIQPTNKFNDGGPTPNLFKPRYIPIKVGEVKDLNIRLDEDGEFHFLYLKANATDTDNKTESFGTLINDMVKVTIFSQSNGARELMQETSLSSLQGDNGGMAMVRHPFLLPRSGIIVVRVTNKFNSDIRLNGFLSGYKIQQ